MSPLLSRLFDALYDAERITVSAPNHSPPGTDSRRADDTRRMRERRRRDMAIATALAALRPRLRAEARLTGDAHLADLARVYAVWPPRYAPTDRECDRLDAWRAECDRADTERAPRGLQALRAAGEVGW